MGCTVSKSLALQARLEGWDPPPTGSPSKALSFVRSMSMPLRRHIKPSIASSSTSLSDDHINNSGVINNQNNINNSIINSNSSFSGEFSGELQNHVVALTSSTYGALRMEHDQEQRQEQQAHQGFQNEDQPRKAKLLAVPEAAEVIDLAQLLRDLNEDEAHTVKRRQRRTRMMMNRSMSSVHTARELHSKIRRVALTIPDLDRRLRRRTFAESSPHSIFPGDFPATATGKQWSRHHPPSSVKGLFYGHTLTVSDEPSSPSSSSSELRGGASGGGRSSKQLSSGSSRCSSSSVISTCSLSSSYRGDDPASAAAAAAAADEAVAAASPGSSPEVRSIILDRNLDPPASSKSRASDCILDAGSGTTAAEKIQRRVSRMMSSKVCAVDEEAPCPPGGRERAVLYVTSLRGIRKTFEDCCAVRSILQGLGVAIDERDVSMHAEFRAELRQLMSHVAGQVAPAVPRLFLRGVHVGGAEEVAVLNESGALAALVEGMPRGTLSACDGCGGARFVPCGGCCGSCKLLLDDGGVARCPDCNDSGLVRCPVCL